MLKVYGYNVSIETSYGSTHDTVHSLRHLGNRLSPFSAYACLLHDSGPRFSERWSKSYLLPRMAGRRNQRFQPRIFVSTVPFIINYKLVQPQLICLMFWCWMHFETSEQYHWQMYFIILFKTNISLLITSLGSNIDFFSCQLIQIPY